jgi:hypothetical protein
MMTTKNVVKGSTIAAMEAGMFMSMAPATASASDAAKIHCQGVNSCKGKGKGWVELSEKDCKASPSSGHRRAGCRARHRRAAEHRVTTPSPS